MHVCHTFLPSLELGFHSRVRIYEFLFTKSRRFLFMGEVLLYIVARSSSLFCSSHPII